MLISKARLIHDALELMKEQENSISLMEKEIEEIPTYNGWISVKDRLPEEGEWVLCLCRAGIREVLRWKNEQWLHDLSPFAYVKSFVTYWMPIPDPPPKEGEVG